MRALVLLVSLLLTPAQAPRPAPFVTPLTPDDMKDKQAVIETTAGTFVVDSIIGPLFAGGSVGPSGHHRLYISLGPLFR